ncbi:MAG: ATP-dependent metallopeptidase FtsH/Yme1/Tma family protein [Chloroflexi bacterium]|nr:ATP-dependent metallopeptidase FtsH/Yme1/Tma family protein [Chloroflexota bacterium]
MNSKWMRNGFIYLLIVVAVIAILFTLFSDVSGSREVPIDEVISMAKRGQIETIEVSGDVLTIITTRQEILTSRKEPGSSVVEMLQNSGIDPVASNMNIIVKGSSGIPVRTLVRYVLDAAGGLSA